MFQFLALLGFMASSIIGGMVIGATANAYIIPTYYPGMPPITFEKATLISAVIIIIVYLIFSPKIHSERLKDYMRDGYSEPPIKKKK